MMTGVLSICAFLLGVYLIGECIYHIVNEIWPEY